jgi:hypothetical protein
VIYLSDKLSPAEQKVFDRVCQGDVMCKELTPWESGAVPSLIQKGIVEVYKRNVSTSKVRMIKFLRLPI